MFSNFKDAFIRRPQFTSTPPKAVIDAINHDLPEGFEYVLDENGYCYLTNTTKFELNAGKILCSQETYDLFKNDEKVNIGRVMQYAYNSQTPIKIAPRDDGTYIINGETIKSSELIRSPYDNLMVEGTILVMQPPEFPEPFKLTLGGNGYSIELKVQRKANNSINIYLFETLDDSPIKLSCKFNIETTSCSYTISIPSKISHSVSEVMAVNQIFNAFMLGKGSINNMPITETSNEKVKMVPDETIDFWEKVKTLEEIFNVEFDACRDIYVAEVNKVYELYRTLVEKRPFKLNQKYNNLKGSCKSHLFTQVEDMIGKEMFFEFVETEDVDLLGVHLRFYGLVAIYGAAIEDIVMPENEQFGEFEIKIKTAEDKTMYSSTMYFITEEDLKTYRDEENHIDNFSISEEIAYIRE